VLAAWQKHVCRPTLAVYWEHWRVVRCQHVCLHAHAVSPAWLCEVCMVCLGRLLAVSHASTLLPGVLLQAFTLIVEFNDSPEGLVVSVEVIIGAAVKGYDAKNPTKGVPVPMAKAVNTMLLEAVMEPYRKNGDFEGALDAVTRHVVEEFGNLPNFVPKAWGGDVRGKLAAELSAFKKNIINLVKPGSPAAVQATNATAAAKVGLSAAHPKATAAQLQAAVAAASTAAPAKKSKLQAKQQ